MSRPRSDVAVHPPSVPPGPPRIPRQQPSDAARFPQSSPLRPPLSGTSHLRPNQASLSSPLHRGTSSSRSSSTPRSDEGKGDYDKELSSTVILGVSPYTIVPVELCNCFFMIGSGATFCVALYVHFTKEPTTSATSSRTYLIMILLHMEMVVLFLSAAVFVEATVGLVGCLRKNITLLTIYNCVLLITIAVWCGLTVAVTFLPNQARKYVKEHVTEDYLLNYRGNLDFQKVVDDLQTGFKCCGVTERSFRDWDANPYFRCIVDNPSVERCSVPFSCCRQENVTVVNRLCGRGVLSLTERDAWKVIYTRGCADAVYYFVASNLVAIVCCCILFNLGLILLFTLSTTTTAQLASLAHIYNHYYACVYHGQARMARRYRELEEDEGLHKDPVLVLKGKYEAERRRKLRQECGKGRDDKDRVSREAWRAQSYVPNHMHDVAS